jgi:hypothetical protein
VTEPTAFRLWSSPRSRSRDGPSLPSQSGFTLTSVSRRRAEEPSRVAVDYLADPSFSAHKHARESLLRCLPNLPARDADTALAALDATETDLRNQRTQMRVSEDDARDQLRRALQASARLRAATVLEADQADEVRRVAGEAGKKAVSGLGALVAPLRTAKSEKDDFRVAADLVGLLAEDKAVDIVRSAESLAQAQKALAESANKPVDLFEGDIAAMSVARENISGQVSDLASLIRDLAVRGASSADAPVVRMCLTAASRLSASLKSDLVKAAVDAIVAFDGADVVSHGSSVLLGTATSGRERQRSRLSSLFPGVDPGVVETLAQLHNACDEAIECAVEFCTTSGQMFPDFQGACLLAMELLMSRLVVLPAHIILNEFEEALKDARRNGEAGETDLPKISGSATRRRAQSDAVVAVVAEETRFLDALASIASIIAHADGQFTSIAAKNDLSLPSWRTALEDSCAPVRPRLSAYFSLEIRWLEDRTRDAFGDVGNVAPAPARASSSSGVRDESYLRYRVSFLRISALLPQMAHRAASSCLCSLRRCTIALALPRAVPAQEPGANHEPSPNMGLLLNILVDDFVASATFLLEGLDCLLPESATAAYLPDMWASGSSPLASFCKTLGYVHDASKVVDDFLGSLQLQKFDTDATRPGLTEDATTSLPAHEIDERLATAVTLSQRRSAQTRLREGLESPTAATHRGIESSVYAVTERIAVLLSADGHGASAYFQSDATPPGDSHWTEGESGIEPSMPFISACAFLEQQLGVARANLPRHNLHVTISLLLEATHDAVLRHWRSLQPPKPPRGGLQMAEDGRAVAQVFGRLPPAATSLSLLPEYGAVLSVREAELEGAIEAPALARAEAQALADLIGLRPDGDGPRMTALRRSLVSADGLPDE